MEKDDNKETEEQLIMCVGRKGSLSMIIPNCVPPVQMSNRLWESKKIGEKGAYFELNQNKRLKKLCSKIRHLCRNNFYEDNVMHVTLTFDSEKFQQKNFKDLGTARDEFRRFIKRMNTHYVDFRHVTVYSRQGNGNIHFHMLCNLDANTKHRFIREIWGLGRVETRHKDNVTAFNKLVGYMCENLRQIFDELPGEQAILHSEGLQDNVILKEWKPEDEEKIREVAEEIKNCSDLKKLDTGNDMQKYISKATLSNHWNPIVMATLRETKFKHKKYRPKTRKKKGGGANVTGKPSKND